MSRSPIPLWSFPLLAVGLVLLSRPAAAPAQQPEMYPSAMARSRTGTPRPNVELPASIPAPEGKLTFYADFAASDEKSVPLYLVNRTNRAVEFFSEDSDISVKLEHRLEDGTWERAQACLSSLCGNSYYSITLPPAQHYKFSGYQPATGTKARVRFASHGNQIVSNEGDGFYLQRDVEDSQLDSSGRYVSRTIDDLLQPVSRSQPQRGLPQSSVVAVRLLQASGPNPYYQKAAANLAEAWENKSAPSADEIAAAKAIRDVLGEPWPEKRSYEALLVRCVDALIAGPKPDGFGLPENDPVIVWWVLRDLAESGQIKNLSSWKPLLDLAESRNQVGDLAGIMGIASVPRLADELIPDSFFEKHLLAGDRFAQNVSAAALARRGQFGRLAGIGWKLNPEGKLTVFRALAFPTPRSLYFRGETRNPNYSGAELAFWNHCMEAYPLDAAYVLQMGCSDGPNPFNRTVHDPLRQALAVEAEKGAAAPDDFDLGVDGPKLRLVVQFLASWNLEEDNPVLMKLLEHRGFEKSEGSSKGERYIEQRFNVRDAAKQALLKRGQRVPENMVLERRIPR